MNDNVSTEKARAIKKPSRTQKTCPWAYVALVPDCINSVVSADAMSPTQIELTASCFAAEWLARTYRKCRPSGRNEGNRCVVSPWREGSTTVTGSPRTPPLETRAIPACVSGANRITPLAPHVPPRASAAEAIVIGAPPSRSSFLSLPSAKNASSRLSGDQKGKRAPSDPGMICGVVESRARRYNDGRPVPVEAAKVIFLPSGESDSPPTFDPVTRKFCPSGDSMDARISGGGTGAGRENANQLAATASATSATTATAQARPWPFFLTAAAAESGSPSDERAARASDDSAMRASPISRSRVRRSRSRQRSSRRRTDGGVSSGNASCLASSRSTEASVSEIVSPPNVRLPVSIS